MYGLTLIGCKIYCITSETQTSVVFVMPVRCQPLEMPALALYQTKPPNAGIVLTQVSWLAAISETAVTGITFISGSNTLEFANYFASGTVPTLGVYNL